MKVNAVYVIAGLFAVLVVGSFLWSSDMPVTRDGEQDTVITSITEHSTAPVRVPSTHAPAEGDIQQKGDIASFLRYLYTTYKEDLLRVRKEIKQSIDSSGLDGVAFDGLVMAMMYDLEVEINYLRVRYYKPDNIMEMAPAFGYSTHWLLHGLRDNNKGHLYSFDIHDYSLKYVPKELSQGRWNLTVGNAITGIPLGNYPVWDYIFIDADHSLEFGRAYCHNILNNFWSKKTVPLSVHDIYSPLIFNPPDQPSPEGIAVLEWLAFTQRAQNVFTVAPSKEKELFETVMEIRKSIGLDETPLNEAGKRFGPVNPTLFAELKGYPTKEEVPRVRRMEKEMTYLNCDKHCPAAGGLIWICC